LRYQDGPTPEPVETGVNHQDELPEFTGGSADKNPLFDMTIDDWPRDILVDNVVAYQDSLVCARIAGPNWLQIEVPNANRIEGTIKTGPCPSVTRSAVIPYLKSADDSNEAGVATLSKGSETISNIDSTYYAPFSVTFAGHLNLVAGGHGALCGG